MDGGRHDKPRKRPDASSLSDRSRSRSVSPDRNALSTPIQGTKRSASPEKPPSGLDVLPVQEKKRAKTEKSTAVVSKMQERDRNAIATLRNTSQEFAATVSQLSPMVRVGLGPGGKGTKGVTIGPKGEPGEPADVSLPRSTDKLKKEARGLGEEMRDRFVKLSPGKRKKEIGAMRDLGQKLQAKAFAHGVFQIPEDAYSATLGSFEGKRFNGDQFRTLDEALDEQTQSAITTAFHEGFGKAGDHEDKKQTRHATTFKQSFLVAQSAMRLNTAHTIAPVISRDVDRSEEDESGTITSSTENVLFGHQHVTAHGIPQIERGVGVSGYSHRDRAQGWVDALQHASSVTEGAFVPLTTSLVAAGAGTMRGMAHPLSGVPGADEYFNQGFIDLQTTTRDNVTKSQTNTVAKAAGLKVDKSTQPFGARKQPSWFPSSPLRPNNTDD